MYLWLVWAFLAAVRLGYIVWRVDRKKSSANWVPWSSVAHAFAVLMTCTCMSVLGVGGFAAALVYGPTIFFDVPVPRAILLLFLLAASLSIDAHTIIITCMLAAIESALSTVWIYARL